MGIMVINSNLKKAICSLFEVHADEEGVQRIVTPLEYPGSNDVIVVRVRPSDDGFTIDENGEAAFYASLNGGDIESEAVSRWSEELSMTSPVTFTEEETISAFANDERLIAPYIFRVAEAAQQLHAIATARADRQSSDFKERIHQIVKAIALEADLRWESDVELPIAGGLKADHIIGTSKPIIIIAATSPTRLLEAEVIYMQYREDKKPGYILAVAENQGVVGKKQYERAAYYTNKTVIFNEDAFGKLISNEMTGIQ
ncbi:MAG: hypothetical protein Q7T66_07170 [Herminiimonas sp.]|uniref:hypothetical protein n=1 Tax=Herminiimonas sp. TaxID=1926289 RepID=UPI00271EDEF1|nr:hypothetical protein [Herminiimonas sp.]MDO9420424.1 hypothetical protein [Herminiimonas sp.]